MQLDDEPKKNYYLVYGAVAVMYTIMIIVYAVVVHNATENGAATDVTCVESELNPCPSDTNAIADFLKSVSQAMFA